MQEFKIHMKEFLLARKQVIFFAFAGGCSAVVEIVLMKILSFYLPLWVPQETNWHGIAFPISNVVSTLCAIIFNYYLSISFVFTPGKHSKKKEITYFMVLSIISMLLSLLIFNLLYLYIIHQPVDLVIYTLSPIIMSKTIAILLVSLLNFTLKKKIIFNG